jgi:outer membrane biosynthesis protein TonB
MTVSVPYPATCLPQQRMGAGLVGSLLLHGILLLLLLWAVPRTAPTTPRLVSVPPINLVQLGAETVSPPAAEQAPVPQAVAQEASKEIPPEAVPVEQAPPLAVTQPAEDAPASPPVPPARPEPKARTPVAKTPKPAVAKQPQPSLTDALSERLAQLSQLKQPPLPLPANPRQQDGVGQSNLAARSADSKPGQDPAYAVKDFIRAQVERRWNPDAIKPGWTVAIHIALLPDGSVSRAEIVDERRYRGDRAYHAFALSARNAVLLSSPLVIPQGQYDLAKDIVVEFDPRRVGQ